MTHKVRSEDQYTIDKDMAELDQKIKRLKIEYEQYFRGTKDREPAVLKGEVGRMIQKYVNEPPRNSMQKFRFNTLCSRFQAFRSLWGRTMREIDAGTYKGHRFRAALHSPKADEAPKGAAPAEPSPPKKAGGPVDRLFDALEDLRRQTGESGSTVDRARLETIVREQARTLSQQHPDSKVTFRVVIEDNRAKLKASLKPAG